MTQHALTDPRTQATTIGETSFWHSQLPPASPRTPLGGDVSCDVAIIGAGFTGLWTAYYLKKAHPDLDVVVIEAQTVGFGASGRNGGWLSAELAGSREKYAQNGGRESVLQLTRAMQNAVDEVIRVASYEGIDADIVKGGSVTVARTRAQLARLETRVDYLRSWGSNHRLISPDEVRDRIVVSGTQGGSFTEDCARVQPLKLVRGLADAVERLGVRIFEHTRCTDIKSHAAITDGGTVTATAVLRCLEGFTSSIRGLSREWLPMNSSMIVTEPLPADVRGEIGWAGNETLGDASHAYVYAQRTPDGRIAIGGRGVPYRYGSKTDRNGETHAGTVTGLVEVATQMFPALKDVNIAHAWSGVLGVPRDWCATVNFDPATGLGAAGGYVGSGLTTTNLAGRTLAALVMGEKTPETELPWVGREVRKWEPEPLRWAGVQMIYTLYRAADRTEARHDNGRTSAFAKVASRIAGR